MKKAIGYIRISTKDQSNFSLQGQEQYIRDFAGKQGYEVISVFKDDGQSAKNFDRPDWKLLQKFCKDNHHQVDALIVSKYDRFSRNLKDALNMIEVLEEKYSIKILSALEPILLNPNSPYFFQFRTQMLMGAQVEWLVIKDRTRAGINTALKSGRYISKAPVGYTNSRDASNKTILLIDEGKALIIKRMFEMFLQGAPLKEIKLEAMRKGFKKKYKSAVRETLTNPVYAGLIKVPAYNDEPEHLVKGLHQGLVSEADWWKVQNTFNAENKIHRTVMNEQVPLRSVLKCKHGHPLTAGNSKGKKQYYWYYKNACCAKHNLSAKKLHDQLDEILKVMSLPDHYLTYLQEAIEKQLTIQEGQSATILFEKRSELAVLQQRLDKVEEKFIIDKLDPPAYKKWSSRYQHEIAIVKKYIADASQPIDQLRAFFIGNLSRLGNLHWQYHEADLHTKQAILRTVFNSRLYYDGGAYRTPYVLPALGLKAALLAEKKLLYIEQPSSKTGKIGDCTPDPPSIEHLTPLLQILSQIKTA